MGDVTPQDHIRAWTRAKPERTYQKAADRLGVSVHTVRAWLKGARRISTPMAELVRLKLKSPRQ